MIFALWEQTAGQFCSVFVWSLYKSIRRCAFSCKIQQILQFQVIFLVNRNDTVLRLTNSVPHAQNKICDNISFPPTFPIGPAFTLSKTVFSAADIAFQPKPNYVQQTLNYTAVKPLYDAVAAYAATQGLTLANRGEAHITVSPLECSKCSLF